METLRQTFPRSHRLSGKLLFAAVFDAGEKHTRGPLVVFSLPNALGHLRLGLSVSRRVGTAPRRNRIKRLLREAFRACQYEVARGLDLVIVVRPHEPLTLNDYRKLMSALMRRTDDAWHQ